MYLLHKTLIRQLLKDLPGYCHHCSIQKFNLLDHVFMPSSDHPTILPLLSHMIKFIGIVHT